MNKKTTLHITIISMIIGFMLAVQYNTVQNPEKIESTDVWEIRQRVADEMKLHSEILAEIRSAQEVVRQYEEDASTNAEAILTETVGQLKQSVGLHGVTGPGVVLHIEPAEELLEFGYELKEIPPSLLIRLVNDIYRYNGKYIEIADQRLTPFSAIRDINGQTTVNSVPINRVYIDIRIVTETEEHATKLYNHLLASSFMDEFYIDNMNLTVELPTSPVTIAGVDHLIDSEHLTEGKGD